MRPIFSSLPLLAVVTALACTPPPNNDPPDAGPVQDRTCEIGGVELPKPMAHAKRKDGQPLDLSCVDNPEQLGASSLVTVQGCVDIFGIGGKAKAGLMIGFFEPAQDARTEEPAYGSTAILTKSGGSVEAAACPKEGWYTIDGVPTNTVLALKVYDTAEGAAQTAIPTYEYYEFFRAEDVVDGVYVYEANLVYKTTYDSIPTLGGKRVDGQDIIYDGAGRGVIAGEVRDCAGVVVENASVTTSLFDSSTQMAYFDGDEEDPTPDPRQTVTNFDGLYVVLNGKTDEGANDHDIVIGILDPACTEEDPLDCECVSLGGGVVKVFPDSVTIYSPQGTPPLSGN